MTHARSLVIALAALASCSAAARAGEVEARDAWIRPPPPGAQAAAGYLTLHNAGETPRRLLSVRSESAARVELHETVVEDGVARMRPLESAEIPARGELRLAPRGRHLMLIGPAALAEGDRVALRLALDGAEVLEVTATVGEPAAASPHAPLR